MVLLDRVAKLLDRVAKLLEIWGTGDQITPEESLRVYVEEAEFKGVSVDELITQDEEDPFGYKRYGYG